MNTVHKYEIVKAGGVVKVLIPAGGQVLTVQLQHERACIWVLVDPERPLEERRFQLVGTGWPISEVGLAYVGTIQLIGGDLVFHLFEVAGEDAVRH